MSMPIPPFFHKIFLELIMCVVRAKDMVWGNEPGNPICGPSSLAREPPSTRSGYDQHEATARGDDAGRRRGRVWSTARRRATTGLAAELIGGGGIMRRRRGGKWRARAWGGISARCVFVRVRRDTARCSRRLTFGAPDRANSRARPKKIAVPPRIPRLLEGLFHLRARYIGGFFSACAL
jgi:hypothetical protein